MWKDGETVTLTFNLAGKSILGANTNKDKAALTWGPLVLAFDQKRNEGLPAPQLIGLLADASQPALRSNVGNELSFSTSVRIPSRTEPVTGTFVPFGEAGRDGGTYRVWLRGPGVAFVQNSSVLSIGEETRSRPGNVEGSINDGDTNSFVVTFNGRRAAEDWYAITLDHPVAIRRVVFVPGKTFHDGGWFDASGGKPRIEIRRDKAARWETVGTLSSYPATTATQAGGLDAGTSAAYTLELKQPVQALAVRVIGRPASGDNPAQGFSSCAELMAFGE
jgi:hypothetical protein